MEQQIFLLEVNFCELHKLVDVVAKVFGLQQRDADSSPTYADKLPGCLQIN